MMEAGLSLMQMAKTSARLSLLAKAGLPYISVLTDPTTGGVTASFAMLGDMNIAEPNALIGFAGLGWLKRPLAKISLKDFSGLNFLLEHGFLDAIVERKDLKEKMAFSLRRWVILLKVSIKAAGHWIARQCGCTLRASILASRTSI